MELKDSLKVTQMMKWNSFNVKFAYLKSPSLSHPLEDAVRVLVVRGGRRRVNVIITRQGRRRVNIETGDPKNLVIECVPRTKNQLKIGWRNFTVSNNSIFWIIFRNSEGTATTLLVFAGNCKVNVGHKIDIGTKISCFFSISRALQFRG